MQFISPPTLSFKRIVQCRTAITRRLLLSDSSASFQKLHELSSLDQIQTARRYSGIYVLRCKLFCIRSWHYGLLPCWQTDAAYTGRSVT